MEENSDKLKKIIKKINNKLKDPATKERVENAINTIEEIFETSIDVSIVYSEEIEEYKEILEKNSDFKNKLPKGVMTLKEFKKILNDEDDYLKLTIDPLYIKKKGLNEIYNVILTTIDDKLIIVPINNREK